MKRIFLLLFIGTLLVSSCDEIGWKRIKGSGNITTSDRSISRADQVKLAGSFDVEITQGATTSVKVEADDNFQSYIITRVEDGALVIKTKNNVSFSSEHPIKIYITTNKLERLVLAGSGNIVGKGKFTGGDKLRLQIAGSGDIEMEVNTPEIDADIAGTGSIKLSGETKKETISIAGVGDFYAEDLKAEDVKVKIAGSGDVKVFADVNLDISIAGVGSVFYKGAATVKQKVSGSGDVKKID